MVKSSDRDRGRLQCCAPLRGVKSTLQTYYNVLRSPPSVKDNAPLLKNLNLLNVCILEKNRCTNVIQTIFFSTFYAARVRADCVFSCHDT